MVSGLATHTRLLGDGFLDDSLELDLESRTDEPEDIKARRTRSRIEEGARVPAKLQDIQQMVDDDARRSIQLEYLAIRQCLQIYGRPCHLRLMTYFAYGGHAKVDIEARVRHRYRLL